MTASTSHPQVVPVVVPLVLFIIPLTTLAQIVADPSTAPRERPVILNTANGLPQVDITAPTAGGVSVNRFVQFDVNSRGAILNNGRTASSTALAGWVAANPALLARPAQVIVNEVRSAQPSQLTGYLEIAGQRAEVIIANPAGITCDGCGFLHANRVELATGSLLWRNGGVAGYAPGSGALQIAGRGLDARSVDTLSLWTQAAQINAGLWANQLNVTLAAPAAEGTKEGATEGTTQGTSQGTAGAAAPPAFALDVAALGGMYANRIYLVGTAHGLGARNLGTLAANEQLVVTLDGKLANSGQIDAQAVRIAATGVDNLAAGRILGETVAIATERLANAGHPDAAPVIAGTQRVDIGAKVVENTDHALLLSGGDMAIGGALDEDGHATGQATSVLNRASTIDALGNLSISAQTLLNQNGDFATEERQAGATESFFELQPKDSREKFDISRFRWEDWSRAGRYRWRNDTTVIDDSAFGTIPLPDVHDETCSGDGAAEVCTPTRGSNYLPNDPAWAYFRLTPPAPAPVLALPPAPDANSDPAGWAAWQQQKVAQDAALTAWETATDARLAALQSAIDAHNDRFDEQQIRAWTQYIGQRRHFETVVTRSDPAQISAGGDITLTGESLINDKSRLLAGGKLRGSLDKLTQVDATGTVRMHESGTSQYTKSHYRGRVRGYTTRDWAPELPYAPADEVTSVVLPVALKQEQAVVDPTGGAAGTASAQRLSAQALFRWQPEGSALLAVDPRFTQYRQWISSDVMLQQLQWDPAITHKRLGDGFIEQRLVREQVAQLTGRRFLPGHADDDAQYAALMQSGLTQTQALKLRPGVALSAEQVAQLTSDLVWLVEQDITLPASGDQPARTVHALVPRVYLMPREGAVQPDGSLIAAADIELLVRGTLQNAGTIAAQHGLTLEAKTITNSGTLSGGQLVVTARGDQVHDGGRVIAADGAVLAAGGDVRLVSTTNHRERRSVTAAGTGKANRTQIDRLASVHVSGPGGLTITAGRDVQADAAAIANGGRGATVIAAGRDLQLGTVQTADRVFATARRDERNFVREAGTADIGTRIDSQAEIELSAGRDVRTQAAAVRSEAGAVTVDAGRDVAITSGETTRDIAQGTHFRHSGAFGSSSSTKRDEWHDRQVVGSTISGTQVGIRAGGDLQVSGSEVVSDRSTHLQADGDLAIAAATATHEEVHLSKSTRSGLMGSGGVGVTIGSRRQSAETRTESTTAVASTVGATRGNVDLHAGKTVTQTGSQVLAPSGDVRVTGGAIDVRADAHTETTTTATQFRQSGITVAVTSPVIAAAQTAQRMTQAASQTKDDRTRALAAANVALAGMQAAQAVQAGQGTTINDKPGQIATGTDAAGQTTSRDANAMDRLGGLQVAISVGSAKSNSQSTRTQSVVAPSTVAAGRDVTLVAHGGTGMVDSAAPPASTSPSPSPLGQLAPGDLHVQGSTVTAGRQATLLAARDIQLEAAAGTTEQQSSNRSSSASVGVLIDSRGTYGVNVAASGARGSADGSETTWTNARVQAGTQVTMDSASDTQLAGAVVSAPHVTATVGGDLTIASRQDTSTYDSRQKQTGGSVTIGPASSANLNISDSRIGSDYASVNDTTAVRAGDGGFDVRVNGNARLSGGVISSTDAAVAQQRNRFEAGGELAMADIRNEASYSAKSTGVNLGAGVSLNGQFAPAGTGVGFGHDSDSTTSVTRAGISGIAGDQAVRSGDASSGVAKIFDAQRVQQEVNAQSQVMLQFSTLAPKAVGDYAAQRAASLAKQAAAEPDEQRRAALLAEQADWKEGGRYHVALHAVVGGLAGDLAGAAGAGVAAAAAPQLNALQRGAEARLIASGIEPKTASAIATGLSATVAATLGAAVGAEAGAGGALSVDANNRQLHRNEANWIKDNAKRFAQQQRISEQEAERRLAQQAFRQVQFGAPGAEDSQARSFLSQANGMLTADPTCPNCGPGYMFYATPEQKFNAGMYSSQAVSDPHILEFYGKNGITQPTSKQIQASANIDANTRSKIGSATLGAAGAAATVTAPPVLNWCLAYPVACNRIVIAGGEIAAGDALGPAGLGVVGTLSAVKSLRSAEEVNAAMKARGWEPAWSPGTPVIEITLQPGTRVNMVIDANTAEAMRRGHMSDVVPGGWATFDDVNTVATDMRQRMAISRQFKPSSDGPFYVVEMEITQPVKSNLGFVAEQTETTGGLLRGGGTQVQFDEAIQGKDRLNFLKPASTPRRLN